MATSAKQNVCSTKYTIFLYKLICDINKLKKKLINNKLLKNIIIFFLFFVLFSCQPLETIEDVIFDNNFLTKISINAEKKIINNVYEINYLEPYIENSLNISPLTRLNHWLEENIDVFGSQNKLIINVIEASLKRIERENETKKKYNEKTELYYEITYIIEFVIYNNNNVILATSEVEVKRSTTSDKFISLKEKENIAEKIILDALTDVSIKSEKLLKMYMFEYIL